MTPTANLASAAADAPLGAAPAAEAESFVLNLCSSTTPMALPQTDLPELKRFTFFVSRRFEEGRERFRLHMGFFASQAEAEEWLGLVREIYPSAWAGEAPGKKLRARATAAAAAQAQHAVGPQKTGASAAARAPTPAVSPVASPVSAEPEAPAAMPRLVPTLHPPAPAAARTAVPPAAARGPTAAAAKPAAHSPAQRPAPVAPPPRGPAPVAQAQQPLAAPRQLPPKQPVAASPAPPQSHNAVPSAAAHRPTSKPAPAKPAVPTSAVAPATPAKSTPRPAARAAQQPVRKPIFADSNVKEVLAALDSPDDAAQTRLMPSPAAVGRTDDSSLTDTQVLRFLESRRAGDSGARDPSAPELDSDAASGISLLRPDDTGTRRALKEAVSRDEAVSFAVQLQWSVQPVALDKVPPLAIFSAYTLYSVEGSREGRKWYGLRLGFFNDAIAAKQVAHYVRSEFTAVAVVPVSPQERERATEDNQRFSGLGTARKRRQHEDNEFKLIDSDEPPRAAQTAPAASPAPAVAPAAPERSRRRSGGTPKAQPGLVAARERRTPQTLEETLEILGANELAMDDGRNELSDTGVRHLRVEIQKNTPFSRLIERLSERVRKS